MHLLVRCLDKADRPITSTEESLLEIGAVLMATGVAESVKYRYKKDSMVAP